MKSFFFTRVLPVFALVCVAACASTGARIKSNQATFDALPAATQAKIREGKVDVGFTQTMVVMALGKPDRQYTRTTQAGQSEVWAYRDRGPAFSFGVGVGGGGHSGVGG